MLTHKIDGDNFKAVVYNNSGEIRIRIEEKQSNQQVITSTLKERKSNISELFIENGSCSAKLLFHPDSGVETTRICRPDNKSIDEVNKALKLKTEKYIFDDIQDEIVKKCVGHSDFFKSNNSPNY